MADFTEWSEAISQAMGYPPMSFVDAYAENRNEQNIIAVNENLVGSIILKYILGIEKQSGPITKMQHGTQEFYRILVDFAGSNDIEINNRYFPKNATNLVKKINTVKPNLKAAYGIIIDVGRTTTDNTSIITIYRKTTTISEKPQHSGGTEVSEVDSTTFNKQDIENSNKNHNVIRDVKNDEQ